MAKNQKRHHGCTILRTCLIQHGTMSLSGGDYKRGESKVETSPCGSPLFDDVRACSGVCRSCADGWERPENKFANDQEKARALAAPKTKCQ